MATPTATDLFASFTRKQIAKFENRRIKSLEGLHAKGLGPPRYKSGRLWVYPAAEYSAWRQRKLVEAARADERRRKRAKQPTNEAAA